MPITEEFLKLLMKQNATLLKKNATTAEQISQLTKTVENLNQTIKQHPRFKELLLTMKKTKETAIACGKDSVSIEQRNGSINNMTRS